MIWFEYAILLTSGHVIACEIEAKDKGDLKRMVASGYIEGDPEWGIAKWLSIKKETEKTKRKYAVFREKVRRNPERYPCPF